MGPGQTVIIRVFPHSDGGLNYDIWLKDCDELDEIASDDGGICTSGCEDMNAPYVAENYRDAIEMAMEQAIKLLK